MYWIIYWYKIFWWYQHSKRNVGGYNFDSKTELVDSNIMRLLSGILVAYELFFSHTPLEPKG